MLIGRKIKNLLEKWKRTPSSAIKQNGLDIIFWWRILQTKIWKAIPREISVCLLCSNSFFVSIFCCLLISPGSAGLLDWAVAGALCSQSPLHVVRRVSPWNHRHPKEQFSILPPATLLKKGAQSYWSAAVHGIKTRQERRKEKSNDSQGISCEPFKM